MNNRRKNRGGPTNRGAPGRRIAAEGVYGNSHFMHAATSQIGTVVRIQAVSGNVWEGIFKTFSAQFDIVLEVAAKVENPDSPHNSSLAADSLVDKLIFKPGDIISMVAKDVDVEYATRDTFQTDTAISARLNGQNMRLEEKELEPWEPSGVNGGDTSLEFEPGSNGWDANEMFRKNEQTYGVQSTYDHSLTGYTVQLQPTDTADYREAEAKANEIANEIENHPTYKARGDLENGDEEERFAAVSRPNQEYSKQSMDSNSATAKYVPPAKRKGQTAGKLMRSTPPPQSQASNAQPTPSPKGNAPPTMPYTPQHPSPHSNPPPLQQQQQQQQQQQHVPPRDSPREPLMHNMHPQEAPPNMHPTPPPPQQHQQQQHPTREQQTREQQQQQQHPVREPTPQHQQQMMHNMHMGHMQQQQQQHQQQQQQPPPQMNHARHAHTPPSHVYNQNNMQRQGGGGGGGGGGPPPNHNNNAPKQMNGDVKMQPQRPPRNVYPSSNMVQSQQQQYQQQELPPKPQEQQQQQQQHMNSVVPRHARDETNKEFAKFSQDFKLAPTPGEAMQQQQQQQQVLPEQQMVQKHPMPQSTPPQQPQQSISPQQQQQQQDGIDKVSSLTLKKSNLNPNAKEFVLNPTAKPFTPRSPSTPTASRPHTPQTPSNPYNIPTTINGPPGQPPMSVMVPMGYMMASQPQYQQQVQGNRLRKAPMGQMRTDVSNVTGQPLLAPAPMQPFVYPPGINPQQYQPMHTVRMYESAPQIQYLTNPANNQSPSQPPPYSQQQHQQQQQQQQQQQYQAPPPQGHPQFNIMCPILPAQAHMMQQGMHYLQQPPPPQGMPTLLAQHHLVQHGPQP